MSTVTRAFHRQNESRNSLPLGASSSKARGTSAPARPSAQDLFVAQDAMAIIGRRLDREDRTELLNLRREHFVALRLVAAWREHELAAQTTLLADFRSLVNRLTGGIARHLGLANDPAVVLAALDRSPGCVPTSGKN